MAEDFVIVGIDTTPLDGLMLVQRRVHVDDRGLFARLYSAEDLAAVGISMECAQVNHSVSPASGTLRGLHFQYPPAKEGKLITCLEGSLYDIVVDLRRGTETFLHSFAVRLQGGDAKSLYIPPGLAHGFLTLEPHTVALYIASYPWSPSNEDGVRFDDPVLELEWPAPVRAISKKDSSWPALEPRLESVATRLENGSIP